MPITRIGKMRSVITKKLQRPDMENAIETPNRVGVWYPPEDVQAAFEPLNRFYPGYIRTQYQKGNLTREQSISMHSIFVLAQEVVESICESGVLAADLMEWLDEKARHHAKEQQGKLELITSPSDGAQTEAI